MVKTRKYTVVWDVQAAGQLMDIFNYVKEESPQGAKKVKDTILLTAKKLAKDPWIFEPDKLKTNNDGSYRSFIIYSYRIAYKITTERIYILRVRHTSREPKEY
ncbi:MAG: hypothetical protein A2W91_00905 [Bacteroidetes bacterium GWF2_38_335]|nr:MAG: hypothetical protein A2W91_00905 [Bacteroidetes bacterium GWF2_38_335]OFY80314.1 MAG: hypothetical protein A2281_17415 [Bacteroidetes bacterium RIFOXYA12_FULL_38_20]HBS88886.1 type II toxin-antitoxin system RelE/ParE family toxin [Bacteroidales bacterium]